MTISTIQPAWSLKFWFSEKWGNIVFLQALEKIIVMVHYYNFSSIIIILCYSTYVFERKIQITKFAETQSSRVLEVDDIQKKEDSYFVRVRFNVLHSSNFNILFSKLIKYLELFTAKNDGVNF